MMQLLADRHVMSDLDEIVDLGSLSDDGIARRSPVYGATGADFHIVLNNHSPKLRNFGVSLHAHPIAEPVLPDPATGMKDDIVANQRTDDRCTRTNRAAAADLHVLADHRRSADHAS